LRLLTATRLKIQLAWIARTSEDAKVVADKIARQIAVDVGGTKARNVVVVDDEGGEVYKTPVKL
jgi:hypothetical protein